MSALGRRRPAIDAQAASAQSLLAFWANGSIQIRDPLQEDTYTKAWLLGVRIKHMHRHVWRRSAAKDCDHAASGDIGSDGVVRHLDNAKSLARRFQKGFSA